MKTLMTTLLLAGGALMAGLCSLGVSALPVSGPIPERLAKELRVKSMAEGSDLLADIFTGPLLEVMSGLLQDMPTDGSPPRLPAALGEGQIQGLHAVGIETKVKAG